MRPFLRWTRRLRLPSSGRFGNENERSHTSRRSCRYCRWHATASRRCRRLPSQAGKVWRLSSRPAVPHCGPHKAPTSTQAKTRPTVGRRRPTSSRARSTRAGLDLGKEICLSLAPAPHAAADSAIGVGHRRGSPLSRRPQRDRPRPACTTRLCRRAAATCARKTRSWAAAGQRHTSSSPSRCLARRP